MSFTYRNKALHIPQVDTTTGQISCMADNCPWTFPEAGPGAQESFEAHVKEPGYE